MYNHIANMPSHIDVKFDLNGTLFMVYLYPLKGTFEVAQWNDGEEQVIDGFFDPLDITDYDEYYGERQTICFDETLAIEKAFVALESALVEIGRYGEHPYIESHEFDIYGNGYEPPESNDCNDIIDAPYCYNDDTNYW